MRIAEEFVRDMRELGRTDAQIRTVAHASHGGKLIGRVEELLAMPKDEVVRMAPTRSPIQDMIAEEDAKALAQVGALEATDVCEKCGALMDDDGRCPEESAHIDDTIDDTEEYCEECGYLMVRSECSQCKIDSMPDVEVEETPPSPALTICVRCGRPLQESDGKCPDDAAHQQDELSGTVPQNKPIPTEEMMDEFFSKGKTTVIGKKKKRSL